MAGSLTSGGFKIDRPSQKMLLALNKRDSLRGSSLRESAELSQNTQVFYRMEEHLIPAGLVQEHDRRHEQDQRRFSLTQHGASWLDAHQEEVELPKSRVETQQMAHEALEEASSAKNSVQSYRQKVSRIDDKVGDTEDDVDELVEKVGDVEVTAGQNRGSINGLARRKADESDVENLDEELKSRIENVREQQQESVNYLGEKIEELREEIADLQQENEELRTEIEKMQRGRIEKFRDRFADD